MFYDLDPYLDPPTWTPLPGPPYLDPSTWTPYLDPLPGPPYLYPLLGTPTWTRRYFSQYLRYTQPIGTRGLSYPTYPINARAWFQHP